MTNISKVRTNTGLTKDGGNVVYECVSIRGTIIDLRNVSPALRSRYHTASRALGRNEKAKSEMDSVAEAILSEQVIKVAPAVRGDHAVAAKLMGLKR